MRQIFATLAGAGKNMFTNFLSRNSGPKLSETQQSLAHDMGQFSADLQRLSGGRYRVGMAYPGKDSGRIVANVLDRGATVIRMTASRNQEGEARFLVIPPQGTTKLTTYGVNDAKHCLWHLKSMTESLKAARYLA